ncbi:HEPN domain-containing protein [Humibacter albus]|uniref:HEPN domain-containing protein n=1 Tax=Humibacter albus TaxID=427754 RepID=UPI0003B40BF1|nr:HEPN domain-containing protein [Humibacter albus]
MIEGELTQKQALELIWEWTSARYLLRGSVKLIRTTTNIDLNVHPILTISSIGVEKLLKLALGLRAVKDSGSFPRKRTMQREFGHGSRGMFDKLLETLGPDLERDALDGTPVKTALDELSGDPLFAPLLDLLTDYGMSARFFHLDAIAEEPQDGYAPERRGGWRLPSERRRVDLACPKDLPRDIERGPMAHDFNMRFALNSNDWPTHDRSFRGDWHLGSEPDVKQPGILTISPSRAPALTLGGTLLGEVPDYSPRSVIGITHDAADITLIRGMFRSQSAPWHRRIDYGGQRPPVTEEVWDGFAVALGARLPLGGNTAVKEMVFRSRRLRDWARGLAPRFVEADRERTIGGTIELPADVVISTVWGKVALRWEAVGSLSGSGADMRCFPEIHIEFDEAPTIDETWALVITPLLQFFSLATGEGDYLECVRYRTDFDDEDEFGSPGQDSCGQGFWGGWFEWVTASWFARPNDKPDVWDFGHVLPAAATAPELEGVMGRWIDLQSRASEPLADYFATLMWASMTFEESFAHIVRALEVLHSVLEPGTRIPKGEFRAVRKKIKQALEEDPHRDLVLSRLKHADAYSLFDRLKALLSMVGQQLQSYAGDIDSFARNVRDARDRFTHASDLGAMGNEELQNAHTILDLVMRSVLLLQLGLTREETDDRVMKTETARSLLYPAHS